MGEAGPELRRRRLEETDDLAVLGKAPGCLLREEEVAVDQHVELRARAGGGRCVGSDRVPELRRKTRGALVVAASGRAVEDLDRHEADTSRPGRGSVERSSSTRSASAWSASPR